MTSSQDFFLSTNESRARYLISRALTNQGFEVSQTSTSALLAVRGSFRATRLWGAFAGKKFQLTFLVDFFTSQEGRSVARLECSQGAGSRKGGLLGAIKTNSAFDKATGEICWILGNAGAFAGLSAI
jgi:hypothetical protein